jgi:hypothetical protein
MPAKENEEITEKINITILEKQIDAFIKEVNIAKNFFFFSY